MCRKSRVVVDLVDSYGVNHAPALVIDGRYLTSPTTVSAKQNTGNRNETFRATLQVADALVTRAAQAK